MSKQDDIFIKAMVGLIAGVLEANPKLTQMQALNAVKQTHGVRMGVPMTNTILKVLRGY